MAIIFFGFSSSLPRLQSLVSLLLYADPGSGAMLWQLIVAFFVGGMFYVSFGYRKIKEFARRLFGHLRSSRAPADEPTDTDQKDLLTN